MSEPDIQKYCDLMAEIKLRMNVIDFFAFGGGHALYGPTTTESMCLQVRKILELVAFGSLVANKELYSASYAKFAQHWHAGRLLRDLEKVNPNFYPQPIVEVPDENPSVQHKLANRGPDYLAKQEFEAAYNECGGIMHAANPYGSSINYEHYKKQIGSWRARIMNLLNNHQVHLVNTPGFYVIHMKEQGDDKVHFYRFEPLAIKPTTPNPAR